MPRTVAAAEGEEHTVCHKDGSLWAKGRKLDGEMHGYWEFFRRNGTRLRSGHFDRGVQVGEWTTYDAQGAVYKVTKMRPRPASKPAGSSPAAAAAAAARRHRS
jgi:hypothetical protein